MTNINSLQTCEGNRKEQVAGPLYKQQQANFIVLTELWSSGHGNMMHLAYYCMASTKVLTSLAYGHRCY